METVRPVGRSSLMASVYAKIFHVGLPAEETSSIHLQQKKPVSASLHKRNS